ncbi:transferase family-domain-containing protein [Penicillium bovifimosum]|uniref:Transferase family-domain-containing protein n=1 Tax=Penicillium bovifimosum TaxID=126998 RepID=A0A9W9H7Q1_9EURO|nr:transferase family-domain-containing protein [Penicillium bovifimosum]KAJ5139221.1 transferase family-domain-containing protein [Penicillium bovifimosum]
MGLATPSPTFTTLGCMDDIMPDIDLPMILSFPCPTSHRAITQQRLYLSFTGLLDRDPWLRGYIHSNVTGVDGRYRRGTKLLIHGSSLSSDFNYLNEKDEKIEFQDLTSHAKYKDKTYPELVAENMPAGYLSSTLLVPDRATKHANVKHALLAKVSFIREGIFVVVSTSHALMDATSLAAIFGAWAATARGDVPAPLPHAPIWQPEYGLGAKSGEDTHTGESKVSDSRGESEDLRGTAVLAQRIPSRSTVTAVFRIGAEALARLKEVCITQDGRKEHGKGNEWISTNDALAALLWRCIVRARMTTPDLRTRTSSLMYAMDMRNSPVMAPGVLKTADGTSMANTRLANIVFYSINRARVPVLLESISLSDTARSIRTAIQKYTRPSIITRALQLAAAIPDVSALGLVYPTWVEHDVVISSLSRLPLYSTSWGDTFGEEVSGVPDIVRWPDGVFEGITFVMPRRRNGSVEIVITMRTADMRELEKDAEWMSYVEDKIEIV